MVPSLRNISTSRSELRRRPRGRRAAADLRLRRYFTRDARGARQTLKTLDTVNRETYVDVHAVSFEMFGRAGSRGCGRRHRVPSRVASPPTDPTRRGEPAALEYGDQRGSHDDFPAQLPRPRRAALPPARRSRPAAAPAPSRRGAGSGGSGGERRRHLLVPHRPAAARASAQDAVERFNKANPNGTDQVHRRSRTTPTRRRSRRRSAPARRPTHHLGLGRRRPEELRRRRPGRGPHRLVRRRTPRSRTSCSRPRSAPPRSTARSTRCRPRRCSRSSCTTTRRSSTRSARSRRSRGATSWPWCRSSTPRASRRSPSAASRAGPT